jgi:putative FmdB family regulatory protein
MPWYDYRCNACSEAFEAQMPVAARDEAICPACGSRDTRRTMPVVYAVVKEGRAPSTARDGSCACGGSGCCGGACACSDEEA